MFGHGWRNTLFLDSQQELRLQTAEALLMELKAKTVLDLGCGKGDLIARLRYNPQFHRIVGVDASGQVLNTAKEILALPSNTQQIALLHCCITELDQDFAHFDAAVLLEIIEHIQPNKLSPIEKAVFQFLKPQYVIMTTPNKDYNPIHGLTDKQMRHHDHKFEWGRAKFRKWSEGLAQRNQYSVTFDDIGYSHFNLGSSTQLALFTRRSLEKASPQD